MSGATGEIVLARMPPRVRRRCERRWRDRDRATVFGREVREEDVVLVLWRDAVPGVDTIIQRNPGQL